MPVSAVSDDDAFLLLRDAYRQESWARFEYLAAKFAPSLQEHPLLPYVDYWRASIRLKQFKGAAFSEGEAFLARYGQDYLAEKLRAEWLKALARQSQTSHDWRVFDQQYALLVQADQELRCYALQSRWDRGGEASESALEAARTLWLTAPELPIACDPLFERLVDAKRLNLDDVWARVRLQFEANKTSALRRTLGYLPEKQEPDAKTLEKVTNQALLWLHKLPAQFKNLAQENKQQRTARELIAVAISRVARQDPYAAAELLALHAPHLSQEAERWVWGQIAWQAALRHLPEALNWYHKAEPSPLSSELWQWKVRAALRQQDWLSVRKSIEKMPQSLANQPDWLYWLGRAYRASGRANEAAALFRKIAGQPNFYGNLADEELGRLTTMPAPAKPPSNAEMAEASANPALQRALTWFRLNLRSEGVPEWNWALRSMQDRQLLAASALARKTGIYDRAISAADRTQDEHDYAQRYISPFADQVRPLAQRHALDDAWVYGLMRQESRFVTQAQSSVGASGLMQLMPATAKWVAKKIGLKNYQHAQVNDTDTNLLLGMSYMRLVLESLHNHPVLASAAYNAGPGRARKWCADYPLEGAIYAETIPFSETRDYVKKVMSNALYYSALFNDNQPQSLKARLGTVAARAVQAEPALP
ncbi:MAG: transglycosylase SLT domain-containing protein [Pseudomonadota bacterium]